MEPCGRCGTVRAPDQVCPACEAPPVPMVPVALAVRPTQPSGSTAPSAPQPPRVPLVAQAEPGPAAPGPAAGATGSRRWLAAVAAVGVIVVALLAGLTLVGGDDDASSDASGGSGSGVCPNEAFPGRTEDVATMIECFSAAWKDQDETVLDNLLSAEAAADLASSAGGDFAGIVDDSCALDTRGMGACTTLYTYEGQTECCASIVQLSYTLEGEGDYYGLTITDVEWQGDAG